jgi:transposase-like protein
MPYYKIPPETKQQILERVKQGVGVPQLARDHGVSVKTIYGWLRNQAEGAGGNLAEVGKLKRENKILLEIIGRLTYNISQGGKISSRKRPLYA